MMKWLFYPALTVTTWAADLPPDVTSSLPPSSQRPVVVTGRSDKALPKHDLPEGYRLALAAASPLVTHPIMGCLDDQGRLYVGDAVGVNWNKAHLEANPPNRVLMLEDTDHDGAYDKSTIFADKMTFPQGACWLNGSLYVASPPGLWKLTDTDQDGVADQREMLVGGFDYTGNAADIHGPFRHPNGRLYWCHGRKGHKVTQKDGTLVDESAACGIWSCEPDGRDVSWHSLGCGDNPVEVDFTPEGDILGVQNLYHSQPRGDTLVHWLYGGVYERSDQLKVIEHLPRTLETMPVMYNFGHVAVSGCCFWRQSAWNKAGSTAPFMVTHFNTQRLVRMELREHGSSYQAVEHEFLKLHDPDIHLTDVIEDPRDGSLLVLDTGGWFRIGCPSSLMAKSDLLGAVYRIQPDRPIKAEMTRTAPVIRDVKKLVSMLKSEHPASQRRALEQLAQLAQRMPETDAPEHPQIAARLRELLHEELDAPLEHAVLQSVQQTAMLSVEDLQREKNPTALRRMLVGFVPEDAASLNACLSVALAHLDDNDAALSRAALRLVIEQADADAGVTARWQRWLEEKVVSSTRRKVLEGFCTARLKEESTQALLTAMLKHGDPEVRISAMRILAAQNTAMVHEAWLPPLAAALAKSPTPLLLEAVKKLKSPHFDAALQALAANAELPLAMRLRALDACHSVKLTGETLAMVKGVLAEASSSAAAKIQAAGMIAAASLTSESLAELAPMLATVGPIELKALTPLFRKTKEADIAKKLATAVAANPVLASQQESVYRTALSDLPPEIFETILHPAYERATSAMDMKKRQLSPLAEKVLTAGDAVRGKALFAAGKGTCIACHQIAGQGRAIGPDLTKIGAIRTERDLLESILFPSNTLARDYEAHILETRDGQQTLGVIRSHTAEGLLVVDVAGQEKALPHADITADTTLTTSLMPMGLDQTMSEPELLDLVAYLRRLK